MEGAPDLIVDAGRELITSGGIYGIVIVGLVYLFLNTRGDLRDERAAHKQELAAKDALIKELQDKRIEENRQLVSLSMTTHTLLDDILSALRTSPTKRRARP